MSIMGWARNTGGWELPERESLRQKNRRHMRPSAVPDENSVTGKSVVAGEFCCLDVLVE